MLLKLRLLLGFIFLFFFFCFFFSSYFDDCSMFRPLAVVLLLVGGFAHTDLHSGLLAFKETSGVMQ